MLLRHGVRPEVIDFVQHIKCSICIELSRKPSEPQTSSGKLEATAFRDLVGVDEFHVTLSDGHKVMLVMIIDVASRLAVSYPLARATTSVSAEELVESLERAWLSWGGPMKKLRADPAKAHLAAGVERFYSEHGSIPDITPAEGHNFQAVTERHIHAWKEVFSSYAAGAPWSSRTDPGSGAAALTARSTRTCEPAVSHPITSSLGETRGCLPRRCATTRTCQPRVRPSTTAMRSTRSCSAR